MSILRADSIRDRAGTGAPDFPNGLTGNLTGTASTATLANTATVATNAQGLTGTPNITVGTVTGTDATFSGNLTVQGTTTTIDTAVTSVDSLAVDGQITGLGNCGIGTTNPGDRLEVSGGDVKLQTGAGITRRLYALGGTGSYTLNSSGGAAIAFHRDSSNNDEIAFETHVQGSNHAERVRITSSGVVGINTDVSNNPSGSKLVVGGRIQSNAGGYWFAGANGAEDGWHVQDSGGDLVVVESGVAERLRINSSGNVVATGTISDSKGDLRKIPFKQESSAYTLVLADSGKAIEVQGDVTVPNNVFNSGDTITIINDSSSNKTISKGTGLQYMFNTADGTNANRTLGGRGMATIYFVNATTCYISGSQLT